MSSTTEEKKSSPAADKPSNSSLLSASAAGAFILIALQVGSRALTFGVNQILLRYLSPELLGIATHLEIYSITVLFFARESLRVAIQRQTDVVEDDHSKKSDEKPKRNIEGHVVARTPAGKTQTIVNLSYISIALGVVLAVVFGVIYTYSTSDPVILNAPYFTESLELYGVAIIWELFSEPFFVYVQQKSKFGIRARAESIATLLRCLVTCGSAAWAYAAEEDLGVLPFALGQGIYSLSLAVVYYASTWGSDEDEGFSFTPQELFSEDNSYVWSYFSKPFLGLGRSLFGQAIVKHILTQGDTLVIASLTSKHIQGVYALANNYGGLVARLLLQPIEESSRNYFGKSLASKEEKPSKDVLDRARFTLAAVLRTYIIIGSIIATAGPKIVPILFRYVIGSKWEGSGVEGVLGVYCYYIPLLAINGITEAFVSSVATKEELNRQSSWMLVFSAAFGGSAYFFVGIQQMGGKGIVLANCFNMFLRIIWSFSFMTSYFSRNGLPFEKIRLRPEPMTIASGVGMLALMSQRDLLFKGAFADVWKAALVILVATVNIAIGEKDFIMERIDDYNGLPIPVYKKKKYDDEY